MVIDVCTLAQPNFEAANALSPAGCKLWGQYMEQRITLIIVKDILSGYLWKDKPLVKQKLQTTQRTLLT